MAWYPGATKMELQPESDDQPAIQPTQFIVHSIAAPWTPQRTYEYWRDSTNLESHFGLGYNGALAQFIGTETRADANAAANRRADGTGAISVESASNLEATDPWTDEQIEELIKLGVWAHQHPRHAIPLRICRSADDPGFGWHRQFSAWNPSGHACPGATRIRQFKEVVFPGIVARTNGQTPEENDVALTDAEIEKIARKVLTLDGVIVNPTGDPANTHIALASSARNIETIARRTEAKVNTLTGVQLTDTQIATLAAAVSANPALAEQIAERVAAKLAARLAN